MATSAPSAVAVVPAEVVRRLRRRRTPEASVATTPPTDPPPLRKAPYPVTLTLAAAALLSLPLRAAPVAGLFRLGAAAGEAAEFLATSAVVFELLSVEQTGWIQIQENAQQQGRSPDLPPAWLLPITPIAMPAVLSLFSRAARAVLSLPFVGDALLFLLSSAALFSALYTGMPFLAEVWRRDGLPRAERWLAKKRERQLRRWRERASRRIYRPRPPRRTYGEGLVPALESAFPSRGRDDVRKQLEGTPGGRYADCHARLCAEIMGLPPDGDPWSIVADDPDDLFHRHWLLVSALSGSEGGSPEEISRPEAEAAEDGNEDDIAPDEDEVLLSEMWYADDRMRSWSGTVRGMAEARLGLSLAPLPPPPRMLLLGRRPSAEAEAAAAQASETATAECQCCFVDQPLDRMVSCRDEGHLFCRPCVRRYAEERVFGVGSFVAQQRQPGEAGAPPPLAADDGEGAGTDGPSVVTELTCLHGDGCSSGFKYQQLSRALPLKTLRQYEKLRANVSLVAADIPDLCQCPKCDFQAILPSNQSTFQCPECSHSSCRLCRGAPHGSTPCPPPEDAVRTRSRTRGEEARTDAMLRTCPRYPLCRRRFLRDGGCNKMTCPCGAWTCYVCRAEIPRTVGYDHFCRTPHCRHRRCGKCPLYWGAEDEDREAQRVAEAAGDDGHGDGGRGGAEGGADAGRGHTAGRLVRGVLRRIRRRPRR